MRTKNTIVNFLTDAIPQIVILLIGFFKIKIFIKLLGNDQVGLYQLYGQIMAYLILVEGGVGTAILFRLYKPIKEKNNEQISSIMSAASVIFKVIGTLIIVAGVILSFFVHFFVKDTEGISRSYMQITFIIYLLSQACFYFTIHYRTMFEAEQKRYIPNIIFQTATIIKGVLEIVIALLGHGLIEILISLTVCTLVANLVMTIVFKKYYKDKINMKAKKDFSMLKDVKDLSINTLGNLLTNNIDILIISKIIGLPFVVIYTTYNYFVEALKQFVDKIAGATMASVGDLIIESKEKAGKVFDEFNQMVSYIGSVLCAPLFIIVNQFIDIWYEGEIVTSISLAILFTIILYYQVIRIPLKVYTFSSGKFREIKIFVILEILINVTLSIILAKFMGIPGVLIATVTSLFIADFTTKPVVIYKKIIDGNCFKYYIKAISNMIFVTICLAVYYFIFPRSYSNIFICILFGGLVGILHLIVTTLYYKITNQVQFFERIPVLNKVIYKLRKQEN